MICAIGATPPRQCLTATTHPTRCPLTTWTRQRRPAAIRPGKSSILHNWDRMKRSRDYVQVHQISISISLYARIYVCIIKLSYSLFSFFANCICSYMSGSADYDKASTRAYFHRPIPSVAVANESYLTPLYNVRRNVTSRSMYKDADSQTPKSGSIG